MGYVIHYHNEHAFDNPGECEIYGPYGSLDEAKDALLGLVKQIGDPLFKLDPDPYTEQDGTYAGFYYEELIDANRNEDLAGEKWAEIVELKSLS